MTDTKAERVYAVLQTAATRGARCPTNEAIAQHLCSESIAVSAGSVPGLVSQLARDGRIVVRLYGHNWREVMICEGRHKGKQTLPPLIAGKPWRVIGVLDSRDAG
jgi:hypothetical protein